MLKTCPKCGVSHEKLGVFCSRSCANSKQRPPEVRAKISAALKGKAHSNKGQWRVARIEKICPKCGSSYIVKESASKKYCSVKCANKNAGGYREGSGRAKSGYYKGIYCGSTYELCWLIYQIDHNLEVTRFEGTLESNGIKYIPDFIQDGKIIEIKGYEKQESVDKKSKVAADNGYDVIVLRKDDIQHCFDWVKEKYKTYKFYDLYDTYKPKYNYVCSFCKANFNSDHKRNTEHVYCSRSCSLKGTAALHRTENSKKVSKTLSGRKRKSLSSKGRTQPFQG